MFSTDIKGLQLSSPPNETSKIGFKIYYKGIVIEIRYFWKHKIDM